MANKSTARKTPVQIGETNKESIRQKMLAICTEYKVYYLWFKYAPKLLPEGIKTYKDLQARYEKFPKKVTEEQAELWLLEEQVQTALKVLLSAQHKQKLIDLYQIYYDKAKEDTNAFKAFVEFSNTFFADESESELTRILKGVKVDE